MYHVKQFPYCGLSMPARTFEDSCEARADVADLIRRRRRQGYSVALLVRGQSWEVLEPEGAAMVPDACGTIELRREQFECRECGAEHDTREGSAECCYEA